MSYIGYRKGNRIKRLTNRAEVMSSNGHVILVDLEDVEKIMAHTWSVKIKQDRPTNKYAATYIYDSSTKKVKTLWLHRFIKPADADKVIDHINRNPLDNRKSNLRVCTHLQNSQNRIAHRNGIQFREGCPNNPWRARIRVNGKLIQIGHFPSQVEAEAEYRAAQAKYFGEFAPRGTK